MDKDNLIKETAVNIENILQEFFGIETKAIEVNVGPAFNKYILEVASEKEIANIPKYTNDIALATKAPTGLIRIEAPIPGTKLVGIEIASKYLQPILFEKSWKQYQLSDLDYKLPVFLGVDVESTEHFTDLVELENILMAGTTGSGKSNFNNVLIWSLLLTHSPKELQLYISDVKKVEFHQYVQIPHIIDTVHDDIDDIFRSLENLVIEKGERGKKFKSKNVKDFDEYNSKFANKKLPYIVIIVDTFSDMMMYDSERFENIMGEILPNSKKYGMYAVLCDSRPSRDVFSPKLVKLFSTKIAFNTASIEDSKVILGQDGAERLLGRGDMLFLPSNKRTPLRLQGIFLSYKQIKMMLREMSK